MVISAKNKRELKILITIVIAILSLMLGSVFMNMSGILQLFAIPYSLTVVYLNYHLAFDTYETNKIMDHVLFLTLLSTIALTINASVAISAMTMSVIMILIARFATKRGKI